MKKLKIICFLSLVFVLSAFKQSDYRVETLNSEDDAEIMVYIPKNFCRYEELSIINKLLTKILGFDFSSPSNTIYSYRKCSEDLLFNQDKIDRITSTLTFSVPKKSIMPQTDEKNILSLMLKNLRLADIVISKNIEKNLPELNIEEELENEKLSESKIKYIHNIIQDLKVSYENVDFLNREVDNDSIISSSFFKKDDSSEYMNAFSGFINSGLIDISYSSEIEEDYLSNKENFINYIDEIKKLNKIPDNLYFQKENKIINIKMPNYGNYRDISDLFKRNGYSRVITSYNNDNEDFSQVFLGIIVNPDNLNFFNKPATTNTETEYKKLGLQADSLNIPNTDIFEGNEVQSTKYTQKNHIRYTATINKQRVIYHYYLIKLKNQNVIICASLINKTGNFTEEDEKRIENSAEKYIKYLEKINRD